MTKLKIKVTKDILFKSSRCGKNKKTKGMKETNCAISIAVIDIFPRAYVDGIDIYFDHKTQEGIFGGGTTGIGISSALPQKAKDFIVEFDFSSPYKRKKMPEIEFEIKIPDEVIKKINIDELRPLLENHPTLELLNISI